MSRTHNCPDCASAEPINSAKSSIDRRTFLKASGAVLATTALPVWAQAKDTTRPSTPESMVKVLYDTLSEEQRQAVCFPWDYQHPKMGLLRTRISANWNVTDKEINSEFFSDEQRDIIRKIFEGMVQPEWHAKFDKQLEDDAGGFGESQAIAIFGNPHEGKSQFVMTGRHMTMRCDGDSAEHVAFGGPIFYGHDPHGTLEEEADHEGNVFWHQALEANKVFEMLDGKQRKLALVKPLPRENAVGFRAEFPGIPVSELSSDQREQVQKTLQALIEPYRQTDRDEVVQCLKKQGGLDACSLAFYQDGDIGNDGVWDCWRLEGPSFVWYFRGAPHVHVWVNVADSPKVELNA